MARAAAHRYRPYAGRTLTGFFAVIFAIAALVLATGATAHADPSPGEIEAQIDQKWNALEPLLEQWNSVNGKLSDSKKKVAALQAKIAPLKMQVDLAMTRVGALSARYYEFGPGSTLNALLTSGTPTTFIDQLGALNAVARGEAATIADVSKLRAQYQKQEQPIDELVAQLSAQQKQLDTQKAQLQGQLKDLQRMRLAAYGSGGGTGNLRPVACPQVYNGDPGSRAAKFACHEIGKPYVWGADGPNTYDCSGLTKAAWASVGVSLPHNAYEQKQVTKRVSRSDLQPGDLVYYYSDVHHVVLYVGNGWVVSAPTTGEDVQMQKLDLGRVNSYGRP